MQLSALYIDQSPECGRGVFTNEKILADTILEISSVIVLPHKDKALIDQTYLYNYYFLWGEEPQTYAIALGNVSLYNHSSSPNCEYLTYYEEQVIHIRSLRTIEAGEELTVNYHGDPESQMPTWFQQ